MQVDPVFQPVSGIPAREGLLVKDSNGYSNGYSNGHSNGYSNYYIASISTEDNYKNHTLKQLTGDRFLLY